MPILPIDPALRAAYLARRPDIVARSRVRVINATTPSSATDHAAVLRAESAPQPRAEPDRPKSAEPQPSKVGYKSPPVEHRFQPGRSGNLKGRPKKARGLNTIVREVMLQPTTVRTARGERKVPKVEALVMKTVEFGSKGNLRAIEKLLNLYAIALPDSPEQQIAGRVPEPLSATDEATLAALRAIFAAEREADEVKEGQATTGESGNDGEAER